MFSELEALILLVVLGFVGGYLYRTRGALAGYLRARRERRLAEIRAKRRIWKRWV